MKINLWVNPDYMSAFVNYASGDNTKVDAEYELAIAHLLNGNVSISNPGKWVSVLIDTDTYFRLTDANILLITL